MEEQIGIHGFISLYKIPDEWSDEDFKHYWCPKTGPGGQILVPARISDETRQSWLVVPPVENLITNAGIALLLTNMSVAGQGGTQPFAQILSVGNGVIAGATRGDTSVAGDGFATNARKAPASYSVVGFTTTIVTNFAGSDAQGTWTNIGFYGYSTANSQNATTTSGTGALATHALFSFVKGATAYAVQYTLTISN